jgi:hypothetical protein
LKESAYFEEEDIVATTELVTREVKKKKAEDATTLAKIRELAKGIEVPASSIAKEDAGVVAQQLVEATEDLQELATSEVGNMLMVVNAGGNVQEDEAAGSEAAAPEAVTGNPNSPHSKDVIVVESDSTQSTSSQSTSSSSSSDDDDILIGLVYPTTKKSLSSSTKLHKKPSQNIPFEPMIPSVNERIGNMSEMRNKVCERLPFNHPLQPPMIQPLNMVPAEVNVSQPPSTNQNQETSVLDNLVSYYSGELPSVEPNSQKASEVVSMEVTLESRQHQAPNLHMPSSTSSQHASTPKHIVPELAIPEQFVHDQTLTPAIPETVSESNFMITSDAPDV